MKKFIISIIGILTFAGASFAAGAVGSDGNFYIADKADLKEVVIPDSLKNIASTFVTWKDYVNKGVVTTIKTVWGGSQLDYDNAGIKHEEMQKFLLDNIDGNINAACEASGINKIFFSMYIESEKTGAAWFKTLTKEQRIKMAWSIMAGNAPIISGDVNKEYILSNKAFITPTGRRYYSGNEWRCWLLPHTAGMIVGADANSEQAKALYKEIKMTLLAQGRYEESYQKFFKDYIKSLPADKAKETIKNELTAFAIIVNPEDAAQTKWLTTLRLLNTTYSEL